MSSHKPEIIARIVEFGHNRYGDKHGWKTTFAKDLGFSSVQQLNNILYGNAAAGKKFFERIQKLGCDIDWLMTGNVKGAEISSDKTVIQFSLSGQLTPSEKEKFQRVIDELEKVSKTDPEAAEKIIKIMDTIFRK